MKSLKTCAEKSLRVFRRLKQKIPFLLDDSEGLTRRCKKKAIKRNGQIHKSAFYFGHPEISADRSKYRPYKETMKGIPQGANPADWRLIQGLVRPIRQAEGVKEIKANPLKENPAHVLIVCALDKKSETAESLSKVFQHIPSKEYLL